MEVLIAMTILSVGLLAIASMQIAAIQTTGSAKSISKGVMWAEDRMEYLSSLPYTADPELVAGANKPDPLATPDGFTITYSVVNGINLKENTKTITLTVQWNERGMNKTTTLTGVKAQL